VSTKPISMQEWMEYFRQATQEVAGTALKFEKAAKPAARGKGDAADDGPHPGAYIVIMSQGAAVRLGITASAEGCRAMARSLLGLHPTQDVSESETGDAVSELMNIIAGKVKSRVSERDQTLQLGLPTFMKGRVQETGSMERLAADLPVGPVTCQLVVYRSKRPG
jgi:CheY-specific phosphatase CheX